MALPELVLQPSRPTRALPHPHAFSCCLPGTPLSAGISFYADSSHSVRCGLPAAFCTHAYLLHRRHPAAAYRLPTPSPCLALQDARAEAKKENPDLAPKELMSKLAEMWRSLSDDDKAPYEEKAADAKDAYVKAGGGAKKDGEGKAKKAASKGKGKKAASGEEGEKPKRGPNAYMIFSNEKRAGVKAENPEMKVTEIAKVIGEMWKELSEEEKQEYKDKAAAGK